MPDFSLTQKWLQQNIQPYGHGDIVYNHVDAVLAAYPTLRPKTDVYTFDDGRSQLLLCVHGLLPISYRRASYNIPIAVWLTLDYPVGPPLVYVVPTSEMLVKAGKVIDVSGRCEPTYLHSWQKKSEGCSLQALMEVLTDQFSREPPVYAKSQEASPPPPPPPGTSSTPQIPDYYNRPPPPAPGSSQINGSTLAPSPGGKPTPPPRPTLNPPSRPVTQSPPPPILSYSRPPSQNVHHPPRSATSSAVPQDLPMYSTPSTLLQSPLHTRGSSVTYFSPPSLQGSQVHTSPEPVPPPSQRWSMPPGNMLTHLHGPPPVADPHVQPVPSQVPSSMPRPPTQLPIAPLTRNFLEEDDDDVQKAATPPSNAPPRPPNPEILRLHALLQAKFTSEFATLDQALVGDVQRLRTAQSDLLAGEPAIHDEMARLEAVRDVCRVVADRLRTTVDSATSNLAELRRKGDPEVDELICSTTIVYNQLIDLVAEDNAIEDTIYHLHRALNAGRIDLDKFLRTSRALAEEQFMKRALAEKIVASFPLGAWT